MNNNQLSDLLKSLRDSTDPAIRQEYINCMKLLVISGRDLDRLNPNEQTKKNIEVLEKEVKDYKIYC